MTILCRGDGLEKSMSRYLVDQLATRPNIRALSGGGRGRPRRPVAGGDRRARHRDRRRPRGSSRAGCSSSSGPTRETDWLPPEIARDGNGYVLTGWDMRAAGHWELDRDPYLLETSVPGIFACGDVRFGPVKRVAAAVGEGSMAIAFVHQYLQGCGRADDSGHARGPQRHELSQVPDLDLARRLRRRAEPGPVHVRHGRDRGGAEPVEVVAAPTVTHVRYRVVH